jgi:hypothetical protein
LEGHDDVFKSLFKPFIIDIQNHGRPNRSAFVYDKVNEAYTEKNSRTFLCSDLFRSQLEGFFEHLKNGDGWSFGSFTTMEFSPTGAARSMSVDVKNMFRKWLLANLVEIPDTLQHILER